MTTHLRRLAHRLRHGRLPASPPEVERAEYVFYASYLREGMVVLDVGAHVGELTLLFSRLAGPHGQVHAFEPCRETFARLGQLCRLAGCRNVVLNQAAAAEREGTVELHVYDEDHSEWTTRARRPLRSYGIEVDPIRVEEVPAITVDAYCERHALPRIDLLKIDVEGAELQVLLGARRALRERRVSCCVFEYGQTTHDMGNTPAALAGTIAELGYRVRNVVKGDPVFPPLRGGTAPFSVYVAEPVR